MSNIYNSDSAIDANRKTYDSMYDGEYLLGAPHLSHFSIRNLYNQIVQKAYDIASQDGRVPTVLDLGAGDGTATIAFLSLGAHVTAVDVSLRQLEQLRLKCAMFDQRLVVRCCDVYEVLDGKVKFDIVISNSFYIIYLIICSLSR